jgi:hypothetical protein
VEVAARASFVVSKPIKTSGRSTRYVPLAITTAGRFGFCGAGQHANDGVAGFQRGSSCSSSSNRLSEAAVYSRRSASDQESDQSILVGGVWREAPEGFQQNFFSQADLHFDSS